MTELTPGTLVVPRGLPDLAPLHLEVGEVLQVDSRISEIAVLTPIKAPELISTFNRAFSDLTEMIAKVRYEYRVAEANVDKVRAICIIDRVPGIIAAKGLSSPKSPMGSEDVRSAILTMDVEYQAALERVIQIQCMLEFLEGKAKAIDKAYMAVKAVYADSSQYRHSPDLTVTPGQSSSFWTGGK